MAQQRRSGPYIWATWLSKILAGDNVCCWGAWLQAHHEPASWDKAPGRFDQAQWMIRHSQALRTLASRLTAQGYQVTQEDQNAFRLRGRAATLAGKPDLVAPSGAAGSIVDVKTGKPRPSDVLQVRLYMWAVPRALEEHTGVLFDGLVAY